MVGEPRLLRGHCPWSLCGLALLAAVLPQASLCFRAHKGPCHGAQTWTESGSGLGGWAEGSPDHHDLDVAACAFVLGAACVHEDPGGESPSPGALGVPWDPHLPIELCTGL